MSFKKNIFLFAVSLLSFLTAGFAEPKQQERSNIVLVSIAPYRFFVEKIAGNTVQIEMLVPTGASFHTYEPTAKQMIQASQADVWFRVGESFETRALAALKNHRPSMLVVDLRNGLSLIDSADYGHICRHCQGGHGEDLHYWLSPRLAESQADAIATALIQVYPERRDEYLNNLNVFIQELRQLDHEIATLLKPLQNRWLLVSHPAYAYFCRDYQLVQYSIEFEGKDPTPQQLTTLIRKAREHHATRIYIQKQYSNKGAKLVATELKAELVLLDPYSENYLDAMREIAEQFSHN